MDPISIHPMLRFIGYVFLFVIHERGISIHPMLRFILSLYAFVSLCSSFQYIPCYGLSCNHQHQEIYMHIFQYIPCYGLSGCFLSNKDRLFYFNTSHVTVYRLRGCKQDTTDMISIHPMLRFILQSPLQLEVPYQISIHPMLRFIQPHRHNF